MRTSNQSALRKRPRRLLALVACALALGLVVGACGSAPPSVAPVTPKPTPVVTPDPQLTDPASVDTVFMVIVRAGLPLTANNGASGTDPVKQLNATYRGWPMRISEYRSAKSLIKANPWTTGAKPATGASPLAIAGLNILIEWGPTSGSKAPTLDAAQVKAMNEFLRVVEPYMGPLRVRTTTTLSVPNAAPSLTPEPSASASAKPSKKPTAAP